MQIKLEVKLINLKNRCRSLPLKGSRFRLLLFLAVFISITSNAFAQSKPYTLPTVPKDTSTFLIFKDITAGPYFTGGISRQNEDVPEGWHSNPRFAYTIGAIGDFTINKWLGFTLGLLYDTRDLYQATTPGDSNSIDMSLGYISLQPSVRIFWLLIGLAFDFPTSASATEMIAHFTDQGITSPYQQNLNVATSDLHTLTELHATLSVPIYQAESGEVHLVVSGNYPLSKTVHGTSSFDTTGYFSRVGQGPLPTVQAGITYQFDLLH
jgi:hypothetical protein